jgi:hypothetical protein
MFLASLLDWPAQMPAQKPEGLKRLVIVWLHHSAEAAFSWYYFTTDPNLAKPICQVIIRFRHILTQANILVLYYIK